MHSDLNNFYASVECKHRPEIANKPVIVVGDREERHGIVLAKNQVAKIAGVKTGDVYWLAKQKCGGKLIEITADFPKYLKYSRLVRKIYEDYTDRVEAYGIDECWLDITASEKLFGGAEAVAEQIRRRVREELGLTVSVGVSWNKIFAKLGSDIKKPDAVTVITPQNYQSVVWNLPAEELLYVGKATKTKLNRLGIVTIGDIARADESLLTAKLGKWGSYLHMFANGRDDSPVTKIGEESNIKSIGNSLTNYRDLKNNEEVLLLLYLLSDSVAARMRESGLVKARTVHVFARSSMLTDYRRQGRLAFASGSSDDIAQLAFKLFKEIYPWTESVRGMGLSVSDFVTGNDQLDIFSDISVKAKREKLDKSLDKIRDKYGANIIQRAIILKDPRLRNADIKGEHVIHPYSYFNNK